MRGGIGIDITYVHRHERIYKIFGARYLNRFLCKDEQNQFFASPESKRGQFLASRWAAKEALWKALRKDENETSLLFSTVKIENQTAVALSDEWKEALGKRAPLSISISHEKDIAVAVAIFV